MGTVEELDSTVRDVLGKLKSHRPFQSGWDTAAFVIFLAFVGTVLLLLLLVFMRCCCRSCCCSCCRRRGARAKVRPQQASRWLVARGARAGLKLQGKLGWGGWEPGSEGLGPVLSCRKSPGEWTTWLWNLSAGLEAPLPARVPAGNSNNACFAQSECLSLPCRGGWPPAVLDSTLKLLQVT
ncbi:Small integral membrane protein 22 [Galemys pyrenaicus]|uniref:Small integral membrane protein 22 n=1 Tax=Galemys pyrenaicus TaxID=202257 RepID=A0A8J5ZX52_GALPY|nr:Small integral membrane protein 22 [Galemys pyrenaicus]